MAVTGIKTLAQIRLQTLQRANRQVNGVGPLAVYPDPYGNSFITTPELNDYINESYGELYELLITQYSNYWKTDVNTFTTVANQEQYPLPLNFFKNISVEWVQQPGSTTMNVVLKRFNLQDRDYYNNAAFIYPGWGLGGCQYTVYGDTLWLKPAPQGGYTINHLYVPIPLPLTDSGSIMINGAVAGNTVTINGVVFTAIAHGGSPTGTQFVIGGTGANLGDAGTATSLSTVLKASTLGGPAGILDSTTSPTIPPAVQLWLTRPATIVWVSSGSTLLLTPDTGTGAAGTTIQWTNTMQAYSGLDEYIITDAALKIVQKEGSPEDVQMFALQKQALIERYQKNYTNRDPGSPRSMTDSRNNQLNFGPWGRRSY